MEKLSLQDRLSRLPVGAQEAVNTCAELLSVGKKAQAVERFKAYIEEKGLTLGEVAALESLVLEKKREVL